MRLMFTTVRVVITPRQYRLVFPNFRVLGRYRLLKGFCVMVRRYRVIFFQLQRRHYLRTVHLHRLLISGFILAMGLHGQISQDRTLRPWLLRHYNR